jgi:hypothetical protein
LSSFIGIGWAAAGIGAGLAIDSLDCRRSGAGAAPSGTSCGLFVLKFPQLMGDLSSYSSCDKCREQCRRRRAGGGGRCADDIEIRGASTGA